MEQPMNVQMICNVAFAIVDGFRVELERVCEEYPEDEAYDPCP